MAFGLQAYILYMYQMLCYKYTIYFMTTWYTVIYHDMHAYPVGHLSMFGWPVGLRGPTDNCCMVMFGGNERLVSRDIHTQIDNPRANKNMLGTGIMIWVMVTATRCCMGWITRLKGFGFSVPMLSILQIVVFLKVPWPHFDPGLFPPCCDSDFTGTTCKNCREDCTDSFAFLNLYCIYFLNNHPIERTIKPSKSPCSEVTGG